MSNPVSELLVLASSIGLQGHEKPAAERKDSAPVACGSEPERPETAMAVAMRLALPGFTEPNR